MYESVYPERSIEYDRFAGTIQSNLSISQYGAGFLLLYYCGHFACRCECLGDRLFVVFEIIRHFFPFSFAAGHFSASVFRRQPAAVFFDTDKVVHLVEPIQVDTVGFSFCQSIIIILREFRNGGCIVFIVEYTLDQPFAMDDHETATLYDLAARPIDLLSFHGAIQRSLLSLRCRSGLFIEPIPIAAEIAGHRPANNRNHQLYYVYECTGGNRIGV